MKALNNFLTIYAMNVRQAWFHRRAATASVLSWAIRMGLTILLYAFIWSSLIFFTSENVPEVKR